MRTSLATPGYRIQALYRSDVHGVITEKVNDYYAMVLWDGSTVPVREPIKFLRKDQEPAGDF